jgi:hypothetical protein
VSDEYSKLDAAICAHIEAGMGHPTNSSALADIARPLNRGNRAPTWRLIDRRMQAMRKSGRLAWSKADRRWTVNG